MTIKQALEAIRAAGISARFDPSDDEQCDDQFVLNASADIVVQICATRNGLEFCAVFYDGEGDDWGATHGQSTRDPVAAAREAIALALA